LWQNGSLKEDAVQLRKAEKRFRLTTRDYAELAAFRRALRGFMSFSEAAAAEAGLTSRHYQAMLVLRGSQDDGSVSINDLAQQLLIRHNSAVGLVDRLERENLIVRQSSKQDRRKVELRLTGRGRQVLAKLAAMHRRELERIGPGLRRFFSEVPHLGMGNGQDGGREASEPPAPELRRPGGRLRDDASARSAASATRARRLLSR
jgi:DNA-binding MarR family transcriptional regulator